MSIERGECVTDRHVTASYLVTWQTWGARVRVLDWAADAPARTERGVQLPPRSTNMQHGVTRGKYATRKGSNVDDW